MVYRVILAVYYGIEEYSVRASVYDGDGRLVEEREFSGVKRITISSSKVHLSAQLSSRPFTLVIETEKPTIKLRDKNILVIGE